MRRTNVQGGIAYAGNILRVNLSTGRISLVPTSDYADRFVGGRGVAAKLYWDLVSPETRPLDPENCLIFATGPLGGFAGFSSTRCQVVFKSPASTPESYNYANIGGHWPAQLKFAGYDALVVEGASEKPVYLEINDERVEIKDAAHLWGRPAVEVRETLKSDLGREFRVLAIGPAGENRATMASLLADGDASGSSGGGAVMGSKKLKAIVVRGTGKLRAAQPEKARELIRYLRTATERAPGVIEELALPGSRLKRDACFGCIGNCHSRAIYTAEDGTRGKFMCQSSRFYETRAARYYGVENEVPHMATRLCDTLGLDTWAIETMIMWMSRCIQAGIMTDDNTGLPVSKLGSLEFIEALAKSIAYRQGFGDVLANGTSRAAAIIGGRAPDLITDYMYSRSDQFTAYGPRMFITTGIFLAVEPRHPIQQLHEMSMVLLKWLDWQKGRPHAFVSSEVYREIARRFWGNEIAADYSTYEGKALAAKMIQDRQYVKESLILCDFTWPILYVASSDDHAGDPSVESKVYSAITGVETDEQSLYKVGERVVNLQRAILAREGHRGREADKLREVFFTTGLKTEFHNPECLAPGKDGETICKRGWTVDREKFEELKTEFYRYRGWDPATGLQTQAKLDELGLGDIAEGLVEYKAVV